MTRTRQLGDLGEQWTMALLRDAGFSSIQDLNAVRYNHPGGDFLAERKGKRYFITVKARNKFVQRTRRLNGGYNIFPEKVRRAAKQYGAIPSWITIQLETEKQCYSAYFGTLDSLRNPKCGRCADVARRCFRLRMSREGAVRSSHYASAFQSAL